MNFLDLMLQGLGQVGQATDLSSGPAQSPEQAVLQQLLAPAALIRGGLQAGEATAQTLGGLITPTPAGQPDNPGQFPADVAAQGLLPAIQAARQRFHDAPEAFTGEKGLVEFGLNPLNVAGPLLGVAGKASTVVTNPVLRDLLAGAGNVGTAYDVAAGAPFRGTGAAIRAATKDLPVLGFLGRTAPKSAGQQLEHQLGDLAGTATQAAESLGTPVPKGQALRTVISADTATKAAAIRADAARVGSDVSGLADDALVQWRNHAQQDLRVSDALRDRLGLADLSGQAQGRPLTELVQAAQAAAPGADAAALLARAAQYAESTGFPRYTTTVTGKKTVQELIPGAEPVRTLETVDDVKRALTAQGASPAEIDLAQAQFLASRYGPTFPHTAGTQHQTNAIAQRLAQEAPPPEPPGGAPGAVPEAAAAPAPPEVPVPPAGPASPPPGAGPSGVTPAEQSVLDDIARRRAAGEPILPSYTELEQEILRRTQGGAPRDLRAPAAPGGAEGVPPSAPPVEASPPPGGGLPGAPDAALAGAETVAPPGAPAGPAPAAASGAPAMPELADARTDFLAALGTKYGSPEAVGTLRTTIGTYPETAAKDQAWWQAYRDAHKLPETMTPRAELDALRRAPGGGTIIDAAAAAGDSDLGRLSQLASRYGDLDPAKTSEDALVAHLAAGTYAAQLEKLQPGFLKALAPFGEAWQSWVLGPIRQTALARLGSVVNDATDAMFKSLVYLGNLGLERPDQILPRAWQTAQRAETSAIGQAAFDARGLTVPAAIRTETQAQLESNAGRAFEKIPDVTVRGTRVPLPLVSGAWYRLWRGMRQGMEESARTAATVQTFDAEMQRAAPEIASGLADLLPPEAVGIARQQIADLVAKKPALFTPDQVKKLLVEFGVPEAQHADGLRLVADARNAAYVAALAKMHHIHFDYTQQTNADELLRQFFLFHIFNTRNLPLYGEIFATHPQLWNALQEYKQATTEQATQEGISPRSKKFETSTPLLGPLGDFMATALFGGGTLFWNPARYISSFQQAFQSPVDPSRDESAGGRVLDALSQMGLSIAPPLQAAAQVLGVFGSRQPSPIFGSAESFLTTGAQALTGQPIESPLTALQRGRPLGNARPPSDPGQAVNMRLEELAVERTGRPAALVPEYALAIQQGAANPLWREAAADLGKRGLVERAFSFTGLPVAIRSAGATGIERAQAGVPEVNAMGGYSPLAPLIPFPESALPFPGSAAAGPLTGAAQRDYQLQQRAQQNPLALGYSEALKTPAAPLMQQAAQHASQYSALRDAVLQEYQQASPLHRQAMLQDPIKAAFIRADALQHSGLGRSALGGQHLGSP